MRFRKREGVNGGSFSNQYKIVKYSISIVKTPRFKIHLSVFYVCIIMVQRATCIKVLSYSGQNFATIPNQNMHFVQGNHGFKLIAELK